MMSFFRKKYALVFCLVIHVCFSVCFSQDKYADSLYKVFNSSNVKSKLNNGVALTAYLISIKEFTSSKKIITEIEKLSVEPNDKNLKTGAVYFLKGLYLYENNSSVKSNSYAFKALPFTKEDKSLFAETQSLIILNYLSLNKYDSCLYYSLKYVNSIKESKNYTALSDTYISMARCYELLGSRQKSIEFALKSLDISKQHEIKEKLIMTYLILSSVYKDEDLAAAKRYSFLALKEIGNKYTTSLPECYMMLGNVYSDLKIIDSAKMYFSLTSEASKKFNKTSIYLAAIGNLGNIEYDEKNYDKALKYYLITLDGYKKLNSLLEVAVSYGSLADYYKDRENYNRAILYYDSALIVTKKINSAYDYILNYKGLSETYELMGNYKKAFESFQLYKFWNDSVNNNQNSKKIVQLELEYKYNTQKKEADLAQKNKDIITHQKITKQKYIIWGGVLGAILLTVFLLFFVRSNIIRKKINTQLQLVNNQIIRQKNIIEEKNNEITDSITYASRIQQGIIPDTEELTHLFPNHFVFFKPRNIVSGDFYWANRISRNTYQNAVIAIADCTGHGVPGAFMSLVGNTLLNQTLSNTDITNPAKALDYINQQLPKTIKSKTSTGTIKDGMEIAMCEFNFETFTMQFAGANTNIYLVRDNIIQIYKGDKQPIGESFSGNIIPYTNQTIALQKNDCIYLITDGYADQFGGERGKKFKYKKMEALFASISNKNSTEQQSIIESEFNNWAGEHEQVDDVLVFGIKV